jgi:hypothetical protein
VSYSHPLTDLLRAIDEQPITSNPVNTIITHAQEIVRNQ